MPPLRVVGDIQRAYVRGVIASIEKRVSEFAPVNQARFPKIESDE